MAGETRRGEQGQALILVALSVVVLLGFVALAVDAGHLYSERRQMQNAADAGALAGARVLCENWGSPGTREALAEAAAIDYAQRNVAMDVTVAPIGGENVVTVTVSTTSTTFLAGLPPIGVSEAVVPASATAICGAARSTCNIWPITFPEPIWTQVYTGATNCGKRLVLIDDDKTCGENVGQLTCKPDEVSTGGDRGWLDFAQPPVDIYGPSKCAGNCGASALRCWIDNSYPGTVPIPVCIKGEPGTIGSAFQEAGRHQGRVIKIPLYDAYTDGGACPDDDPVLGNSCNNSRMYHIVTIACVKIIEYVSKYPMPVVGDTKTTDVKALIVEVACGGFCDEGCSAASYTPPKPGDAIGISLVR